MAKFCAWCGKPLEDEDVFCGYCGRRADGSDDRKLRGADEEGNDTDGLDLLFFGAEGAGIDHGRNRAAKAHDHRDDGAAG